MAPYSLIPLIVTLSRIMPTYSLIEVLALIEGCTPMEGAEIAGLVADESDLYHITELNVILYYLQRRRMLLEIFLNKS